MSTTSDAVVEIAAGQDLISPTPTKPTAPMANAIGTRRNINRNIPAKPSSASYMVSPLDLPVRARYKCINADTASNTAAA